MHQHRPSPNIQGQLREENDLAFRLSHNVEVGRPAPKGSAEINRIGAVEVVIAGQQHGGHVEPADFGKEAIQDFITDPTVVENITDQQQDVPDELGDCVHHRPESAFSQGVARVVSQVDVGGVNQPYLLLRMQYEYWRLTFGAGRFRFRLANDPVFSQLRNPGRAETGLG